MLVQAELVQTVTQSARLSKDQGPLDREALSLVSLTRVKSVAPVCAAHTSQCSASALHVCCTHRHLPRKPTRLPWWLQKSLISHAKT